MFRKRLGKGKVKIKVILTIILVAWASVALGQQLSIEQRIINFFPGIVQEVQDHGLSGPIAREAAKYAHLRCIHEDGLDRPTNISYNGMVPGSPNKEVIEKLYMPDHKLGRVTANDGQGCYVIKGPKAHVMGSVAIALWYDAIINSDRLRVCSAEEKRIWNLSRYYSHMIALGHRNYKHKFQKLKEPRDQILQKVNRAYGPKGHSINALKAKLEKLFDAVSN